MSLYGIKDASNLTIISNETKKPILYADYCNKTDINFTSDTVYATAKGVKKIGWDNNREGTMSTEMQIFDLSWIALLMGSTLEAGAVEWAKREVVKVTEGSASLAGAPKTGSLSVYKLDEDGISLGDEIIAGSDAGTYSISGSTITINGETAVTEIVCFYAVEGVATNKSFKVEADKFPGAYTVIGDTTIRNTAGVDQVVQFRMNNIKPKSTMDLTMSADDVCTLSVEWDIFADNNNEMFTFKTI